MVWVFCWEAMCISCNGLNLHIWRVGKWSLPCKLCLNLHAHAREETVLFYRLAGWPYIVIHDLNYDA